MPTYKRKALLVEAQQWDGSPLEGIEVHHGELIYSASGAHFYVSHRQLRADSWLPISGEYKDILPFAFYEVKSGHKVPLNQLSESDLALVNLSLDNYKPRPILESLGPWGYIATAQGRKEVNPGDWVVTGADGLRVYKNAAFANEYELAEAAV